MKETQWLKLSGANFVEREVGLIYRGSKLWLVFTSVKLTQVKSKISDLTHG